MATTKRRKHRRELDDARVSVSADRLRQAIRWAGVSVNELAARAGPGLTSQQNLDYIVRGRNRTCRATLLAFLGKELGVSPAFLSGQSNEIPIATALGIQVDVFHEEMRSLVKSHSTEVTFRIFQKVMRPLYKALLTMRRLDH